MKPEHIFFVRCRFHFSVCSRLDSSRSVCKFQYVVLSKLSKTWIL